uniref:Zinc finger protein CONSTANS-LIKE 2 n=1 Tax=Lagerstroemia indica TaxID=141186 RepID=A0A068LCU9_9MYRT|nr:zinc finger protein CONSTANS-LIKE 2 [Lagerstroemia indica]
MLKVETTTTANDGGGATSWARTCDTCCTAASAVYCRADLAYLCTSCDARTHAAANHHDRVWLCESCERAPAEFLCKADSASLCAACDAEVHSANPLARRHHRVPIQPIPGTLYSNTGGFRASEDGFLTQDGDDDEDEAASWLLLNPMKNGEEGAALVGGEVDEYLDLEEYTSCENNQFSEGYGVGRSSYGGGDSVVPIQYQKGKNHCFQMGLEGGYGYPGSMSHSVSMEVGVVPESTSEVSMISHTRTPKGTIDLFSSPPLIQLPPQLSAMDREARVLRYREKKKNRKFEKTIRYASRKAYAETRPRIKGRFAKRRDVQVQLQVDHLFSDPSLMPDTSYGVVPSF